MVLLIADRLRMFNNVCATFKKEYRDHIWFVMH